MNINEMDVKAQKGQVEQIQAVATTENVKTMEVKPRQVKDEEQTPKINTEKMTLKETSELVESLENYTNTLQTNIGFSVNTKLEKVIVTITNKETDEVIRQIPPEELITLLEKMEELTGILFSKAV